MIITISQVAGYWLYWQDKYKRYRFFYKIKYITFVMIYLLDIGYIGKINIRDIAYLVSIKASEVIENYRSCSHDFLG